MRKDRVTEDRAECGRRQGHPEPCQHIPVETTLTLDFYIKNDQPYLSEKLPENIELESVEKDPEAGTMNLDVVVEVSGRCYEGKRKIRDYVQNDVPEIFHLDDSHFHVLERLGI